MSNVEYREKTEKYREKQMLDSKIEDKIKDKMLKNEKYSDIVYCPNQSCGVPVKVIDGSSVIILKCAMCGFEKRINKNI